VKSMAEESTDDQTSITFTTTEENSGNIDILLNN
jgi:hypothetical protein